MRIRRGRAAALVAALASLATSGGAATPIAVAGAPVASRLVGLEGATPPAPGLFGAKVLGPAPARASVEVQLYLRPRDSAGLQALATDVSTPGSPSYHHFLTVPQFAARFGAGEAEVRAVDDYLRSKGLSAGALAPDHLAQAVRGTAKNLGAAFGISLNRARTRRGAYVIGSTSDPELPATIAGDVAFVDGLGPWATITSDLVRLPPASRKAAAASTCSGMADAGLTPAQLAAAYRFTGFYDRGDKGQGETIGFIEYARPDNAAIAAFQSCTGSAVTVDYDPSPTPPTQENAEVADDVEVIAALAPKATVVIYADNQSGAGLAPWQMAVSGSSPGGLPAVISSSWGACEPDTGLGRSYYQAEETLFQEAASQGQTVLVASGDDGSEGCYEQEGTKVLAVVDPASAPDVTAVGGTGSDTVTGSQYVWNSHGAAPQNCLATGCALSGASGGGASTIWPRPSYQAVDLAQSPACTQGAAGCREVPDVSALAGDAYAEYCSGTVCGTDPWVGFGGTSLSAPSWGAAVLLSESLCATRVGFLNPLLYAGPTSLTGLVTLGDNDFLGANSGLYQASVSGGYSMAAGLGYLGGADLSSGALCGPGNLAGATTTPPSATTTTTTTTTPSPTTVPSRAYACAKPVNLAVHGTPVAIAASEDSSHCAGYWVVTQTGDVAAFGSAVNYGPVQGKVSGQDVVAIAATPDSLGYWLLTSAGRVLSFGDATSYGEPFHDHLASPAVGMTATPDGAGYWVAARDGGVFAYGDARFYGSLGGKPLNKPISGIAAAPGGKGYWLVGADGGVFGFGDAGFRGSMGGKSLNSPVIGITADPDGDGYRIAAADGGIFSFAAAFYGSLGNHPPAVPVVMMAPTVDGDGYYLSDAAGDVYAYGDAAYLGNVRG